MTEVESAQTISKPLVVQGKEGLWPFIDLESARVDEVRAAMDKAGIENWFDGWMRKYGEQSPVSTIAFPRKIQKADIQRVLDDLNGAANPCN